MRYNYKTNNLRYHICQMCFFQMLRSKGINDKNAKIEEFNSFSRGNLRIPKMVAGF